ncbi:MAG: hypothetical protein JXA13_09370 [Anaerolineales bacterium]|nr:hypothetical protein [Anaerolineales bacterium]
MAPVFNYLSTHIGSIPHPELNGLAVQLAEKLDIPAWPQMVKRSFHENMYTQYSPMLPALVEDIEKEKIYFDTSEDYTPALERFYTPVLEDDVDAFALKPDYAAGFFALLEALQKSPGLWAKGQVTGPVSFGLTVTDQNLRASLYDEMIADAIIKNTVFNARWQVRQLKAVRPNVIQFVDEPYMASFGSAFISLSREQVITMLDEVFEAIQSEGAVTGVHCCANTDWGLLLSTRVDILNLDAYGYIENLALYPQELRNYLDRGGAVAWGIIPNNEEIRQFTPEDLANRLREGIDLVCEKAITRGVSIKPEEFANCSLITPACGLGSTSIEIANEVIEKLSETGRILQKG